ncbi:hypothetical protein RugamoR57_20840 [Duganella caerulea]|uniref:type II toxin-antitoxin system RelE/ParE family toxin n=1 Tax=Duganella caerulea TaxID=2885762 RepID=UPI0030E80DAC
MRELVRTATYLADLDDIERYIARDNPVAASQLCDLIDDQADQLADPNFPRRRGRVKGTFELVVHKHYVVVFIDDLTTVTLLNVIHTSRKYP